MGIFSYFQRYFCRANIRDQYFKAEFLHLQILGGIEFGIGGIAPPHPKSHKTTTVSSTKPRSAKASGVFALVRFLSATQKKNGCGQKRCGAQSASFTRIQTMTAFA